MQIKNEIVGRFNVSMIRVYNGYSVELKINKVPGKCYFRFEEATANSIFNQLVTTAKNSPEELKQRAVKRGWFL